MIFPLQAVRSHGYHVPIRTLLSLLACTAAPLSAQAPASPAVEGYTLPNGLEVVLAPDRGTQVVAVTVWYRVGSQDDPANKAGLARLFERLMFAGSANVPDGAHSAVIEDAGGHLTALVDEERSRFGSTLPSNRLGLGLWLEADRMRSLAINDTSVSESETALLDELGGRLQREPYAAALATAIASVYDSTTCPGFARSPLAQVRTVTTITTAEVRAFYQQYYAPGNARLVVAGDFDPAAARPQIAEFFGGIPSQPAPAPHPRCEGTAPAGATRQALTDRTASRVAVGQFFRIPGREHPDAAALELLGIILSQGPGGRLRSVVVRDARAADATQGGRLSDRDGPGVFGLFAVAAPGVSADSLGKALSSQLDWAASQALTDTDLQRARAIFLATTISDREREEGIADALQRAPDLRSAGTALTSTEPRVERITTADIRRVAAAWIAPAHALTLVVTPEAAP